MIGWIKYFEFFPFVLVCYLQVGLHWKERTVGKQSREELTVQRNHHHQPGQDELYQSLAKHGMARNRFLLLDLQVLLELRYEKG